MAATLPLTQPRREPKVSVSGCYWGILGARVVVHKSINGSFGYNPY